MLEEQQKYFNLAQYQANCWKNKLNEDYEDLYQEAMIVYSYQLQYYGLQNMNLHLFSKAVKNRFIDRYKEKKKQIGITFYDLDISEIVMEDHNQKKEQLLLELKWEIENFCSFLSSFGYDNLIEIFETLYKDEFWQEIDDKIDMRLKYKKLTGATLEDIRDFLLVEKHTFHQRIKKIRELYSEYKKLFLME